MPFPIGPALSAGANIFGALLGDSDASRNRKAQMQMAQNAISWRVADAKRAGVHPLFAMGASMPMYSPVSSSAPDFVANAGQDIGRALETVMTRRERLTQEHAEQVYRQAMEDRDARTSEANINRLAAETDLLVAQSAEIRRRSGQIGPPLADVAITQPRREETSREDRSAEIAIHPERSWEIGHDGFIRPTPSRHRAETQLDADSIIPSVSAFDWEWRNVVQPRLGIGALGSNPGAAPSTRDGFPLRPGYEWRYDRGAGGWKQYRIRRGRGGPRR